MSTEAANVPEGATDEKKLSKKELNKLAKQMKKQELKAVINFNLNLILIFYCNLFQASQGNQDVGQAEPKEDDISEGKYGSYGLVQSTERKQIEFIPVNKLDGSLDGKEVWIRGRLHTSRVKGKTCFVVIRQKISTVQVAAFAGKDNISKEMIKFIEKVSKVWITLSH